MKYTKNFNFLFFLMIILLLSSLWLGVKYKQNHYPIEQNMGFYPVIETNTLNAYSQNVVDKEILSFTSKFLQKAYQNENDAAKFIPENHPNPLNSMNNNKPIILGYMEVTFGDQVPFIKNDTIDEIIEQEIIIQLLLVDKFGNNVFEEGYKVTQNQTHNELERTIDFIVHPDELNLKFDTDSRKEESFTIFYGIKFGYTLSNGSQSYAVNTHGSSYIFFDKQKDAFLVYKAGPEPSFSDLSINWFDKPKDTKILIGVGILFSVIGILVFLEYKKNLVTPNNEVPST